MFLIVQVQYVLGNKNVERFVYNFISILQIHMCVKITIWNIWNGSNRPIWNTKVCYDHSTGTKVIDLLCITDRRWFAHFYERQNFKEECNPLIVFPRLSPLVHIIEILVLVFKGRNLGFWKSTPTQAHRVRCLLQLRDAVGKTSPLWSARQLLPQVQSSISFPIPFFFSSLNSLGTRRLGSVMLKTSPRAQRENRKETRTYFD